MKNNRLTNCEIYKIKSATQEIKRLCKLETANFYPLDAEKDKEIKEIIRPWLAWFESCADEIETIIDGNK